MRMAIVTAVWGLMVSGVWAQAPAFDSELGKKYYFLTDRSTGSVEVIQSKPMSGVTDDDLKELAQFADVKKIELSGSKITGTGLKHFADLKKLEALNLGFCTLSSDGYQELSKLTTLKYLNLINTNYTQEDLKKLTKLKDLQSLWIGQNFNTKAKEYAVLGEFKNLRRLAVSNSNFSDEDLKIVAALPELRTLIVNGTGVTNDGMAVLSNAKNLMQFQGHYTLNEKGLAHLGKLENLRELELFAYKGTVDSIIELPNAKKLTWMKPDFQSNDSKADLAKLKAALPDCKTNFKMWLYDDK